MGPVRQLYDQEGIAPNLLGGGGIVGSAADQHAANLMAHEQLYATPTYPAGDKYNIPTGAPDWLNQYPRGNVKFQVPNHEAEYMKNKNLIRANVPSTSGGTGALRTDPITDREVDYLRKQKDIAEYAKRDAYIGMFYNTQKPGETMQVLQNAPDHVKTRLAQVKAEFDFALQKRLIDEWGVNSPSDLEFRYMLDQGYISGPTLQWDPKPPRDIYRHGILSPYAFMQRNYGGEQRGVKIPFAESDFGQGKNTMAHNGVVNAPLQMGSDEELAKAMFSEAQRGNRWAGPITPGPTAAAAAAAAAMEV
jgi:hypothetical protein